VVAVGNPSSRWMGETRMWNRRQFIKMMGVTTLAALTLAACALPEPPGSIGLTEASSPAPTDIRPSTPDVSSAPSQATVFPPDPTPTVEGSPYPPPLTPPPTLTPAPPPTPIVLPPLPTYPPPGPFSEWRLIYSKRNPPGYYTNRTDGTDEIMLPRWSPEETGGSFELRVAPDGSKILYTPWDPINRRAGSVWIMNPDGSDKQRLVEATDQWFLEDAIWSPDGNRIAYRRAYLAESYAEGAPTSSRELWVMDADGNNQRMVLGGPAIYDIEGGSDALVFQWSLNGYIYFATHGRELYAVNPENGGLYRLMSDVDPLTDLYSAISPSGQHIVLSPNLPAQVAEMAGFIPVQVPGEFEGWSSDGASFVYLQNSNVWLRNVYTGETRMFTPNAEAFNLTVSPDGRLLVFQTKTGLFIVDVNTRESRLLVEDPLDPVNHQTTVRFVTWVPMP
jgi:hypothetical protein